MNIKKRQLVWLALSCFIALLPWLSLIHISPAFHWNPFALQNEVNRTSEYLWNVFSGNVEYTIIEGLKIGTNINGNIRSSCLLYTSRCV